MAARLWEGWLLLLALSLAVAGWAVSQAAWRALQAHPRGATPGGERVIQPVPEALPIAAALPTRSSPADATGTTALPPLPIPLAAAAALIAAEPGVVAARRFSLARIAAPDQARALQCLADAVYYEAGGEPADGQRAVAQVVLNRVRHPAFPATVCGVVYQRSEHAGCQFSFACDGALARAPSRSGWARAAQIAAAALTGYVYAPVGLATHYHSYAVTPAWNRAMVMTGAVGAHLFHRWPGYWGTSAAFRQVYAGGEPLPSPPAWLVAPPISTRPLTAPAPATALAIQPTDAQARSVPTPATAPNDDHLPPAPAVLPRWQDSGKPR